MLSRTVIAAALVASCLTLLLVSGASAGWQCNFESGLGQNAVPIAARIPGLSFSTLLGDDVYFADINSAWYSVTSDNGKVYEEGNYFVSGDVAAYLMDTADSARISFPYGTASYFTVGYSSEFPFVLEAYDTSGSQLASATGPANTRNAGGTGLLYLTVSRPDISYVLLHDQGGYWMIDNISTDAAIPEPSSVLTLVFGLAGISGSVCRQKHKSRNQ